MSELLIKAALAYLLGSIVGSLLIRRATGGTDIRALGSGNAGATNALRTLGMKVAVWVLIIDVGKGWIATARLAPWALPGSAAAAPGLEAWCVPVCGIAVILVEQHARQILPLTRQALVLERGRSVYLGDSESLRRERTRLDGWLGLLNVEGFVSASDEMEVLAA